MTTFWDVAPCTLTGTGQRFRFSYFLHHKGYDGISKQLWNFSQFLRDHTAQHLRTQPTSYSLPREFQISPSLFQLLSLLIKSRLAHWCFQVLNCRNRRENLSTTDVMNAQTFMCKTNDKLIKWRGIYGLNEDMSGSRQSVRIRIWSNARLQLQHEGNNI